jgi:hypothetical protein
VSAIEPSANAWKPPLGGSPRITTRASSYCPFDDVYLPVFRALIFAVFECGLVPRCAQEVYDASEVRIEKIARIIRDCRWGIHDISRTDLNIRGLPCFNMPLELGLFLGAKRFGLGSHRRKSCLVLDRDRYRYQEFISDIAGQDIAAHANDPGEAIKAVRDWLSVSKAGIRRHPAELRSPRVMSGSPASCPRSAPMPSCTPVN